MSYPCPYCRAAADLATGCPGCGRPPDPDAAEVIRLDAEIPALTARVAAARDELTTLETQLRNAWHRRNASADRVRRAVAAEATVTPTAPVAPAAVTTRQRRSAEASTRLVQNALFLLGGLLLGVAAIVFTAVAWSQFGVGGRAALLVTFTVAALTVPPLALRRGLTATAETFAAVGLLLVLLDGYAAWYVDLFGVAGYPPAGYAGAVCAVTAAVAAGYGQVTGLSGPRFAGLAVAQPVLPLLVAPLKPGAAVLSLTMSAVAALDVAAAGRRRGAFGVVAYAFGLGGVLLAGSAALIALAEAHRPGSAALAGVALIAAALVPVVAATVIRTAIGQAVTGGVLVVAVALAGARLADVTGGSAAPVWMSAVALVVALSVALSARMVPSVVWRGPWMAALLVVAVPAGAAGLSAMGFAVRTVMAARPVFSAPWDAVPAGGWQAAAALVLLTVAVAVLVPARVGVVLTGAALAAWTVPAAFDLPWWSAPAADLLIAALALAAAVVLDARRSAGIWWPAGIAAITGAYAVVTAFGRAGVAAVTLACVAAMGIGTAAAIRRTVSGSGTASAAGRHRRLLGGSALAAGMLSVPGVAWTAGAAVGAAVPGQARLAMGGCVILVAALHVVARRWPEYRGFALAAVLFAVVPAPAWASTAGESAAIYAGVGLLAVAATLPASRAVRAGGAMVGVTGALAGLTLLSAAGASLFAVLLAPLGWWGRVWGGRPAGVGLDPTGTARVAAADVVAVVIGAAAAAAMAWMLGGRRAAGWAAAAPLAVAVPMALAAAGARWPAVPAATLLAGLTGFLAVALRPADGRTSAGGAGATAVRLPAARGATAGAGAVAVTLLAPVLTLAGMAGALPTHGSTAAALGAILIVGVIAGAGARDRTARLAGWLGAAVAALALAFTAGRAAELPPRTTAFLVLAAAAVVLATGTALGASRPLPDGPGDGSTTPPVGRHARPAGHGGAREEARLLQAAAHAGAVVALLLTAGSARNAAAVCALWGVALGVRALVPGERATVRHALVIVAAAAELGGWWLLIAAGGVATLEAYTLPAAGVALLAGWLAARSRPALTSWIRYGPALGASLLPPLASVLVSDGGAVRRLLLGIGALAVVLTGARARLQAPVVTGGVVLAVVALHEITLLWDLLPRWIPLATGGLLLVGLAMTLERRRRDLARFRAALTRMG